jgi:hypothetical protein
VSGRVAQVHDERVEVVGQALCRGGVAGAVELLDERPEALLSRVSDSPCKRLR